MLTNDLRKRVRKPLLVRSSARHSPSASAANDVRRVHRRKTNYEEASKRTIEKRRKKKDGRGNGRQALQDDTVHIGRRNKQASKERKKKIIQEENSNYPSPTKD